MRNLGCKFGAAAAHRAASRGEQRSPAGAHMFCTGRRPMLADRSSPVGFGVAVRSAFMWPAFCVLALLTACSARPRTIEVSLHSLGNAPTTAPIRRDFAVVCDEVSIHDMITPLGRRLGLIEITSPQAWDRLKRATAGIGACPDLRRGIVVGVVSSAGRPIDEQWPIELSSVRLLEGAGFVSAEFAGGNYQPDGTSYMALAQVDGLHSVLLVEVNGVRFYPN